MSSNESNAIFHAMIESIKADNIEQLRQQFEENFKDKIFYLHFTIPKDIHIPLQPFLFDVSAAINSEKCTSFIGNFTINSPEEINAEEDAEEELDETKYQSIDNDNDENDEQGKDESKYMKEKEEIIIEIPESDIDTRTLFAIVTDYEGETEAEEEEEDNKDDFTSLIDWFVRTEINEDEYHETVLDSLYFASGSGLLSVVEYLLSYGVDASKISRYGTTVYNGAVFKKNYDMIELFDDYYINQTGDINGRTPLHVSAKLKNDEMAGYLLELGGDPTAADWRGFTPLHIAAKNGCIAIIDLLADYEAPLDKPDKGGRTPLHIAALYGQANACSALYELGASVEPIDLNGMTPMNLATLRKKKHVIKFFDSIGVNNANIESDKYHRKRKSNKESYIIQVKKSRQNV